MKLENIAKAAQLAEQLEQVRKVLRVRVKDAVSVLRVPVYDVGDERYRKVDDVREQIELPYMVASELLGREEKRLEQALIALGVEA